MSETDASITVNIVDSEFQTAEAIRKTLMMAILLNLKSRLSRITDRKD